MPAAVLFLPDVKFRQGEYMSLKKLSVDGSTRDDASVRSGASMDDLPGEFRRPPLFSSSSFSLSVLLVKFRMLIKAQNCSMNLNIVISASCIL